MKETIKVCRQSVRETTAGKLVAGLLVAVAVGAALLAFGVLVVILALVAMIVVAGLFVELFDHAGG